MLLLGYTWTILQVPQYFLKRTGERLLKSWQREKRPSDFFAAPQSNRSEGTGKRLPKSGEEKIIVRPASSAVPKSTRSEETGAQRLSSLRQKRGNKKNITRPQYFLKETGECLRPHPLPARVICAGNICSPLLPQREQFTNVACSDLPNALSPMTDVPLPRNKLKRGDPPLLKPQMG